MIEFSNKIRLLIWIALMAVIFWLFYMAVVPGGKIRYFSDLHHHSYFISQLSPAERLENSATSTAIKGEPAYFSLRTSRGFDKAKVTINYQDNSQSPIIELGVLTDKQVWNYDLKPMQNKILDSLSGEWEKITDGSTALFQRKKTFDSIGDFLSNLPEIGKVATYDYDLKNDYKIIGYVKSKSGISLDVPLRGPYQFYTYIKDEKLDFNFELTDLNMNKDPDPITINVYDDKNIIVMVKKIEDAGASSDNGEIRDIGKISVSADNLPEGAYKIEFKSNNDIITKSIRTRQIKMAFINKIWIYDSGLKNIGLYSDSRVLSAETINPNKLQTINVGGQKLEIKETFKQFGMRTKKQLNEIRLVKDDALLSGDGMFSFNQGSFFNPTSKKINENSNVDDDGIDYIIAEYTGPVSRGSYKQATMEFDLTKAYRENDRYSFLISAPRLGTPSNAGEIIIKDISVELTGKTLLDYLKSQ